VNFALFSERATGVELCLFNSAESMAPGHSIPLTERTEQVWHTYVPDVLPGSSTTREDPVFRAQRPGGVDGAVLGPEAFVLRFFGGTDRDRLLVVNFGRDLHLAPVAEPLLAPPGRRGLGNPLVQ
jgi:hypothetical protein